MTTRSIIVAGASLFFLTAVAAPVFAETTTPEVGATPVTPPKATLDIACVQAAVDVREGAIDTAFSTFSSSVSAALSARKTALHDAWGMTDSAARRAARNKAWTDYRAGNKAAFAALRTDRKAAWTAFASASKACKVPVVEAANSEGVGSLGL